LGYKKFAGIYKHREKITMAKKNTFFNGRNNLFRNTDVETM
jgi:hypothetical protein